MSCGASLTHGLKVALVKDTRVSASLASHRAISIGLLETVNGIQYGCRRCLESGGRGLWRAATLAELC
jgi:hypothetical protein